MKTKGLKKHEKSSYSFIHSLVQSLNQFIPLARRDQSEHRRELSVLKKEIDLHLVDFWDLAARWAAVDGAEESQVWEEPRMLPKYPEIRRLICSAKNFPSCLSVRNTAD